MRTSTDRILTTHVGSLPRSEAVTRGVFAIDNEEEIDLDEHCREVSEAVAEVVAERAPVRVRRLGVPGIFAPTGSAGFLLDEFGMSPEGMAESAIEMAGRSA